jgi:hypothetical protein
MSRHPYFALSNLLRWAQRFCMHEARLVEPGFSFPLMGPVYEIELGLAGSARHVLLFRDEYNDAIAALPINPFALPLRRAIEPIRELIENRLTMWGWDHLLLNRDDFAIVESRCIAEGELRRDALLDTAASWRLFGKNLSRNDRADELAREAELKEIKPSMTPEEGERLYPRRYKEWYLAPSIGKQIPSVLYAQHARLGETIDELEKHFRRETLPAPYTGAPTQPDDWRNVIQTSGHLFNEMLNRGHNWTDHQWDVFGIHSSELVEWVQNARPTVDLKPLLELADVQNIRHSPQSERAAICNRAIKTVQLAIDITRFNDGAVPDQSPASLAQSGAKPKLKPSRARAYSQWKNAVEQNAAFCDTTTDREVYDWVADHDDDDVLPSFATWARYVGEARAYHGTPKYAPRVRATTRSTVKRDDI